MPRLSAVGISGLQAGEDVKFSPSILADSTLIPAIDLRINQRLHRSLRWNTQLSKPANAIDRHKAKLWAEKIKHALSGSVSPLKIVFQSDIFVVAKRISTWTRWKT